MNNDFKTYENIRKIATDKGDDYTTDCLLDYPNLKKINLIMRWLTLFLVQFHILVLSDSNEIRTYNHLVGKSTLNHLAKFG